MAAPDPTQYDTFADEYEAHAAAAPWNALYDRPATLALLGDVAGRQVLDAACGPGLYLEELVARGAEAQGCDASVRMVDLARQRTGGTVELREHRLEEPFDWVDDASLDPILCALAYLTALASGAPRWRPRRTARGTTQRTVPRSRPRRRHRPRAPTRPAPHRCPRRR